MHCILVVGWCQRELHFAFPFQLSNEGIAYRTLNSICFLKHSNIGQHSTVMMVSSRFLLNLLILAIWVVLVVVADSSFTGTDENFNFDTLGGLGLGKRSSSQRSHSVRSAMLRRLAASGHFPFRVGDDDYYATLI
uniref:Secreted protein n=1 Tax=Panagrellus redivivus TaxID=6233 RepID=A0A7E4USR1_PANRE